MNKAKARSRTSGAPVSDWNASPKLNPAAVDVAKGKAAKESPAAEAAHVDLRTELYRGN